jgi:ribosomal protein L21E
MAGKKKVRTRGKIQLSRYFQKLKEGDSVAVIREKSVNSSFPVRLQGRTGVVIEKRGRSYVVKFQEKRTEKRFIIEPIHLKRLENKK